MLAMRTKRKCMNFSPNLRRIANERRFTDFDSLKVKSDYIFEEKELAIIYMTHHVWKEYIQL